MKRLPALGTIGAFIAVLLFTSCIAEDTVTTGRAAGNLSAAYEEYFPVGAAVNWSTFESHSELILEQFNSITCENEMKPSMVIPRLNSPNFYAADEIADFARENGLLMRGHTFVWHQQTPGWIFASMGGAASREILLERLSELITMMSERYGDVVYAWDVVNEAVSDDGPEILRDSPWKKIIGDDYIARAFRIARAAAPEARLFYNDYSVMDPGKQDRIYTLLEGLLADGVPVDGIGMQGHWNLDYPRPKVLDEAIKRFASLGLEVQITELDVSVYSGGDNSRLYGKGPLPERILEKQAEQYRNIFKVLRANSDVITGVTFWGVADDVTWLDDFPVRGRKNWPLLFDEDHQNKPAYYSVVDF